MASHRTAYLDFLNFWKDADPDNPILKQDHALLWSSVGTGESSTDERSERNH